MRVVYGVHNRRHALRARESGTPGGETQGRGMPPRRGRRRLSMIVRAPRLATRRGAAVATRTVLAKPRSVDNEEIRAILVAKTPT